MNPQVLAMINTSSRYANPTVVALMGIKLYAANVMIATPATDDNNRKASRPNVVHPPADILGDGCCDCWPTAPEDETAGDAGRS